MVEIIKLQIETILKISIIKNYTSTRYGYFFLKTRKLKIIFLPIVKSEKNRSNYFNRHKSKRFNSLLA